MSNINLAVHLPPLMKPAPAQPVSQASMSPSATKSQGGLFDQFLTQAEKDYLACQLQQVKWSR
ncbi:MAG: hypothetical protein HQL99_05900 [Magnetococcales bacterium]|nr:hypothetical protein [Magnetococcales bacterium]